MKFRIQILALAKQFFGLRKAAHGSQGHRQDGAMCQMEWIYLDCQSEFHHRFHAAARCQDVIPSTPM
ncbi:MAG: hypothetical protein WDM77_06340 [Steroidobacteraceae bacterium]